MHLCGLLSVFVILVSLTHQNVITEPPKDICALWGDPHLLMFPAHQALSDRRGVYWCQLQGTMQMLKNSFIEVNVDVTDFPHWNENFKIKFFSGPTTLCTITPQDFSCNDKSQFLKVKKVGSLMTITYPEADFLTVDITSYMIGTHHVYDIAIYQTQSLIWQSTGLCVDKLSACDPEGAANPFGKRRKRNLDLESARKVCEEYMKEAYKTAKKEIGNTGSKMAEHARVACIDDVSMSGDVSWGQSAIQFVAMDALKVAQWNTTQRHEKLNTLGRAITQAASRVKEELSSNRTTTRTTTYLPGVRPPQ